MVKTLVFLRAQTGSRPGIESDVMVITVIGEECQLWHSQHYVKAQHLPIEGDRPIEVFDVQVHVSYVHYSLLCECLPG
jgi:hypothetical protein